MPLKTKKPQKYLGLYLNAHLNFSEHIYGKMKKAVKGVSVIKKLNVALLHSSQRINRLLYLL